MRSIREQLEAGEVDGSTAEETRLHTVVDDKRTASFDGQAADISTPQKQADVEREQSTERKLRRTKRDERLIHQMAQLDTADSRQVTKYLF